VTCDECQELLPLYLTGALESGEEAALRAHLATGCAACAGALAREEAVLHQLPLGLVKQAVPAGAWEKIESRIALKEQMAGGVDSERSVLAQPFVKQRTWPMWLGWAAAAAVFFIHITMVHHQSAEMEKQRTTIAALTREKEQAVRDSTDLRLRLTELEQNVKTLTRERDLQVAEVTTLRQRVDTLMGGEQFALSGKDHAQPDVGGKVFKAGNRVVVRATNVKPTPAGKAYELWFIPAEAGAKPIASVVAMPDAEGKVVFEATIPQNSPAIGAVAVTLEDATGSPVPTSPVQFLGPLALQ